MPSTVSSTDAPEVIVEEVAAIRIPPLTPRAIEESNHSYSDSGTPVKGNDFNSLVLKLLALSVL